MSWSTPFINEGLYAFTVGEPARPWTLTGRSPIAQGVGRLRYGTSVNETLQSGRQE
jgi:hypothetical protein